MSWEMHIKMTVIKNGKNIKKFKAIRQSGVNGMKGQIYRYKSQKSAERMIEICYPLTLAEDKMAVEVNKPANMRG